MQFIPIRDIAMRHPWTRTNEFFTHTELLHKLNDGGFPCEKRIGPPFDHESIPSTGVHMSTESIIFFNNNKFCCNIIRSAKLFDIIRRAQSGNATASDDNLFRALIIHATLPAI